MHPLRIPLAAVIALVVVAGFAIGGLLAVLTRSSSPPQSSVAVTTAQPVQPVHTAAPAPPQTQAPTAPPATSAPPPPTPSAAPATAPPPAATRPPTPAPTVAPVRTYAATATPIARTTTTAASTGASLRGSWTIDESNTQVGTIVWAGTASASQGNAIALDVHKTSVAGRTATSCERQSTLHAAFALGVSAQTVPYQEVNCQGTAMPGEVRVTSFASDGRSFSGSFWADGVRLGSFTARLRR